MNLAYLAKMKAKILNVKIKTIKIKTMKIILLILLALAFLSCNPEQCTCTTYLNGTEYSVFTADTNCEPSYYSYQVGNQFWEDICD
jgi:hypothetical protein